MNFLILYHLTCRIIKSYNSSDEVVSQECSLRALCESNVAVKSSDAAVLGSYILMSHLPLNTPVLREFTMAARIGRSSYGKCLKIFSRNTSIKVRSVVRDCKSMAYCLSNQSGSNKIFSDYCSTVYRQCDPASWSQVTSIW